MELRSSLLNAGISPPSLSLLWMEFQVLSTTAVIIAVFSIVWLLPRGLQYLRGTVGREEQQEWRHTLNDYLPLDALVHIFSRIGQVVIVSWGILALLYLWGYEIAIWYAIELTASTWPIISRGLGTGIVLLAAYLSIISVSSWMDSLSPSFSRVDRHDREIIKRVLQISVLLIAALFVLTIWKFDISGLLVGAGVIGVILGFAAQQTLGSVIAGLILMFSRPFEIGDWIVVGEERGVVTEITIVHTRIRGPNGEHISIPNEVIGNQTVRNRSEEQRLRFSVAVGIDYNANIEQAREIALEALETVDLVEESPFPSVRVEQLEDSSVVLRIRFWVNKPNAEKMWKAEDEVLEAVKAALDDANINIPYPHRRFVMEEKPDPNGDFEL